jgi:hypothetical protein
MPDKDRQHPREDDRNELIGNGELDESPAPDPEQTAGNAEVDDDPEAD